MMTKYVNQYENTLESISKQNEKIVKSERKR